MNYIKRKEIKVLQKLKRAFIYLIILNCLLSVIAVSNHFVRNRSESNMRIALFYIGHRVFVQQGQLWNLAFDRVVLEENYQPMKAIEFIFSDSPSPGDRSVGYLM